MQNKWEVRRNEFGHVCKHPSNDDLGALESIPMTKTLHKLENTENGSEYSGGSKELYID
jgi:hypothetical protein